MVDGDVVLDRGVHKGKRLSELTDAELRFVWSGLHGNESSRKRPVYLPATRELYRREGKLCPPWAMAEPAAPTVTVPANEQVEPLLAWLGRHARGFSLAREPDSWVVTSDDFDGWQTHRDLRQALLNARDTIRQLRSQKVDSCFRHPLAT